MAESIKQRLAKLSDKNEARELLPLLNEILSTLTDIVNTFGGILSGSEVWNPAEIADGDLESNDITVTGAALGDFVLVSSSIDVVDLALVGQVTAADTVTVSLLNNTGAPVNLGETTIYVRVFPRTALAALDALGLAA